MKELFAAALEKPADERDAFLRSACQDEPDLRDQILALLVLHEGASGMTVRSPGVSLRESAGELPSE